MGRTLNLPRKGRRSSSSRSSQWTPVPPSAPFVNDAERAAQSPAAHFPPLNEERADGSPADFVTPVQPSPSSVGPTSEQRIRLGVTVRVSKEVNVVMKVSVATPQMEARIRELKEELRRALLDKMSVAAEMQKVIDGLRVELQRGRHLLSYWRRKAGITEEPEESSWSDKSESSDSEAQHADMEAADAKDSEDNESEDEGVQPQAYVGIKRRQAIGKQVWKLVRGMKPACAASTLCLAARRARALGLLLKQKSMTRFVIAVKRQALIEAKKFMLQNQFSPVNWVKWMLQAHVSRSKMLSLRDRLCFDRILVEPHEDDSDDEPVLTRVPRQMHPDHEKLSLACVPSEYSIQQSIKELLEGERASSCVGEVGGTTVKGATLSMRKSILKLIFEARDRSELTRSGQYPPSVNIDSSASDRFEAVIRHDIMILVAGDGFSGKGLKLKGKVVRVGCSLVSQKGWNCSPDDWLDFANWGGKEDYYVIELFMCELEEEFAAIEKAGGVIVDDEGERYHISLLIGGDKPWVLEFTGKMNMNATYPFAYCTCSQEEAKVFTSPPENHDWVDADRAARLAHVSPEWRWGGQEWVDFNCEIESCNLGADSGRRVTHASHDALMEKLSSMPPKQQAKEINRIAKLHYCFKPGRTAPFRWLRILPDPLHAIMNILSPILERGVWKPITYDPSSVREEVRQIKDHAFQVLNLASRKHGVEATFHNDEHGMPKINGNAAKQIMCSGVLDVWLRAVSPVLRLALPRKHDSNAPLPPSGDPPAKRRKKKGAADIMQSAIALASHDASASNLASSPLEGRSDEDYLEALQHAVEGQQEILLATCLGQLTDLWNFLTDKTNDPQDIPSRNTWRAKLFELSAELGKTSSKILGQCTYTHDLAYGAWYGSIVIGAYLRASMEGFEHGNKDMGAIYRHQVSVSGKGNRQGGVRHAMVQGLELRRATTNARVADQVVNLYSHSNKCAVQDAIDERVRRRLDTTEAMRLLDALKSELERSLANVCEPCSAEEAQAELQRLSEQCQ